MEIYGQDTQLQRNRNTRLTKRRDDEEERGRFSGRSPWSTSSRGGDIY